MTGEQVKNGSPLFQHRSTNAAEWSFYEPAIHHTCSDAVSRHSGYCRGLKGGGGCHDLTKLRTDDKDRSATLQMLAQIVPKSLQ